MPPLETPKQMFATGNCDIVAILGRERHFKHVTAKQLSKHRFLMSSFSPQDFTNLTAIHYGLTCPGCEKIYKTRQHWWHYQDRPFCGLFNHPELFMFQTGVCLECADAFRTWQSNHPTRRTHWGDTDEMTRHFLQFVIARLCQNLSVELIDTLNSSGA